MKFFVKLSHFDEMVKAFIKKESWSDNDLLFVDIEKVEGSAMDFLERKCFKRKK